MRVLDDPGLPTTPYGDEQQAQRQDQQCQRLGQPEGKKGRCTDKEQVIDVVGGVHKTGKGADPDMRSPLVGAGNAQSRPRITASWKTPASPR